MSSEEITAVEILSDEIVGQGGFLAIRRLRVQNRRADGSASRPYLVDFIARDAGLDAVVVAAWHRRADGTIMVLLRDGLRPPLRLGRPTERLVLPEPPRPLHFRELPAGIVEPGEVGELGLARRAAAELAEEAGYHLPPAAFVRLGAGSFPSPGAMAERFFFMAVEISDPAMQAALTGDGSPYEEGARTLWMPLNAAIAACERGELEDLKTEIALRRLAEKLPGWLQI